MQNPDWYKTLVKPSLTPPDWVFAPVWMVLYAMIFVSLILFLKTGSLSSKWLPLLFFALQIGLNFAWSPVFFGMQKMKLAFFIICAMWFFILGTIFLFYPYSKIAAILLVPYFLWVSFAAYLNYELVRLNP